MIMSIQICPLAPSDRQTILPDLFAILYENMNPIDEWDEPYEVAREGWCTTIAKALDDPRRRLLVLHDGETIAGFFMYAVNRETGLFLMEEIQFRPHYQGVGLFHRLYDEVLPSLPPEIAVVEAYAHKKNLKSQGILTHFGLIAIGENKNGSCLHYRGDMREFSKRMNIEKTDRA